MDLWLTAGGQAIAERHQEVSLTLRPIGRTMVELFRTDSTSCWTDAPQKTIETKLENRMPAPYSQQMAGKEYRMTCAHAHARSVLPSQRQPTSHVPIRLELQPYQGIPSSCLIDQLESIGAHEA